MDTLGSEIDTVLAVYHRVGLASLSTNLVACDNDSAPDGVRSQVRFNAMAGREYRAFVDGVRGAQGFIALQWKMGLAPAFAPHTTNRLTVRQGGTIRLEAETAGTFPGTHYQWLHNGEAISGATNTTLVLDELLGTHGGQYAVIASNEFGAVSNQVAEIVVEIPYLGFRMAPASATMRIELREMPGQSLLLESSPDLVNWFPLHTNLGSGQPFFLDVATTGAQQAFYRARPLQP
jgi:hypothetical protein